VSFENHPNAKKIFDYYQTRFGAGSAGYWQNLCVNSLSIKNEPVSLSSIVIADAGSYKSTIMDTIHKSRKSDIWVVPSQPTDRAIVKAFEDNSKSMKNKLWIIDDSVTCFPSLKTDRQIRFINLFVTLIMNGRYSFGDFANPKKEIATRMGLCANVAIESFNMIKEILKQTTFLERVVPFSYSVDSADAVNLIEDYRTRPEYSKPPTIKITPKKINFNKEKVFNREVTLCAYKMSETCQMSPQRSSMWLEIILRSIAFTEGRSEVDATDLELYKDYLLPCVKSSPAFSNLDSAIDMLLRKNINATPSDAYGFFESETCKIEFPYDTVMFVNKPAKEIDYIITKMRNSIRKENDLRDLILRIKNRNEVI
jgi:hypothetical protein